MLNSSKKSSLRINFISRNDQKTNEMEGYLFRTKEVGEREHTYTHILYQRNEQQFFQRPGNNWLVNTSEVVYTNSIHCAPKLGNFARKDDFGCNFQYGVNFLIKIWMCSVSRTGWLHERTRQREISLVIRHKFVSIRMVAFSVRRHVQWKRIWWKFCVKEELMTMIINFEEELQF